MWLLSSWSQNGCCISRTQVFIPRGKKQEDLRFYLFISSGALPFYFRKQNFPQGLLPLYLVHQNSVILLSVTPKEAGVQPFLLSSTSNRWRQGKEVGMGDKWDTSVCHNEWHNQIFVLDNSGGRPPTTNTKWAMWVTGNSSTVWLCKSLNLSVPEFPYLENKRISKSCSCSKIHWS